MVMLLAAFIIGQLFPHPLLKGMYVCLAAVAVILSLFYSKFLPRVFGTVMILSGSAVFLYQQQPLDIWIEGLTRNLPLVCLIVMVPVLGIPIGLGNYQTYLAGITLRFIQKPQYLYLFISGLFSLIGPITNIVQAAPSIVGQSLYSSMTSVHTWSPYFASVFLVVYSLNITIYQYLPYGLLLSFFQILTAYVLFRCIEMRKIHFVPLGSAADLHVKKLVELFAVLLLLTGLIFLSEPLIPLSISVLISFTVFLFALCWTAYLKLPKHFFKELNDYRKVIFPSRANEVNLLLTAGFFSVVLSKTPIAHAIHHVCVELADIYVFLLIVATMTMIALLSFIGVHQIVTISAHPGDCFV